MTHSLASSARATTWVSIVPVPFGAARRVCMGPGIKWTASPRIRFTRRAVTRCWERAGRARHGEYVETRPPSRWHPAPGERGCPLWEVHHKRRPAPSAIPSSFADLARLGPQVCHVTGRIPIRWFAWHRYHPLQSCRSQAGAISLFVAHAGLAPALTAGHGGGLRGKHDCASPASTSSRC